MNNIAELQNYPENLQLLYAQKQLYIEAKRISNARTFLSLLSAFYPVAALLLPVMSEYEWTTFIPLLIVSFVFPFF
ncbi:MAG: S-4TM family putative pore-forming effector, partial [Bacteroidota bacterium]